MSSDSRARAAQLGAITIDVDSLRCYHEIHGLKSRPAGLPESIYEVALPRFWSLLDEVRAPATLFLIGADAPAYGRAFAPAAQFGAEIASHSFAHDYRLITAPDHRILADLKQADAALAPLSPTGQIRGFRAPGYNTSGALLNAVQDLGYAYDSSLLPSPLYFGLRAATIGLYTWRGHPSRSLPGRMRAFAGPTHPYPVNKERPWLSDPHPLAPNPLVEIPIACEPYTRIPLIGTTWTMLPERMRRWALQSACKHLPVINFEMHAIDLLDRTDPGITFELGRAQPDLAIPAQQKMRCFSKLFHALSNTVELTTLAGIAGIAGIAAVWI